MEKVGIVLSGCGRLDGSEIHESVCTALAVVKNGAEVEFLAPNIPQAEVINHAAGTALAGEVRNVLVESARIARGVIRDLAGVSADQIDAVIFPGGSGAVKNLCTYAEAGADCAVNEHVERLILGLHGAGKPIGAECIAPVLLARVLGKRGVRPKLTIGTDKETASAIEAMGGSHVECGVDQCVVDEENKLVTTPCYMLAKSIDQVYAGAGRLVTEILRLI